MLLWWASASVERGWRGCDADCALETVLTRCEKVPRRAGTGFVWLLPVVPDAT